MNGARRQHGITQIARGLGTWDRELFEAIAETPTPLYHELQAPEFSFSAVDGPTCIARDGEARTEYDEARFVAKHRILPVFCPLP